MIEAPASSTPVSISGLPALLPRDAHALLIRSGGAIALAEGEELTIFELVGSSDVRTAEATERYSLPGHARALAESQLGLVVAVGLREKSVLLTSSHDCRLIEICEVPGTITALVAAGAQAYALTGSRSRLQGRLVRVDLRQRVIAAERQVEHPEMTLSVDAGGRRVLVTDPAARRVLAFDPELQPIAAVARRAEPAAYAEATPADDSRRHPRGCCCVVCMPVCDGEPTLDERPPGRGDERPHDGEAGHDGQVGVPGTGDGTIVGDGSTVTHHRPGVDILPCDRDMLWQISRLQRAGPYVVASDLRGQNVALLAEDMNLLDEWTFGRGGSLVLASPDSTKVVMHVRSSGTWTLHDVHDGILDKRPWLERFPIQLEESKTFLGQPQLHTLSYGQGGSPTSINGIVLPVIEGDQVYNSPDLAGFGAYMHRTTEAVVRDYYHENSFGIMTDVDLKVFGVDVGPRGGPLKLPRHKLADYFFPDYVPARVELTRTLVAPTSDVVLDGRESLTVDVKPNGGAPGGTVTFPFFALAFQRDEVLFPVQVKFFGTEQLPLVVTTPTGASKTLNLQFTAKTIDIPDLAAVPAKLGELATYLDGVMKAAETAAGIGARLFSPPKAVRIPSVGADVGRFLVTFNAADTSGSRLAIKPGIAAVPGSDPLGIRNAIVGTIGPSATYLLKQYLENVALLAQEANPSFGYTNRILNPPTCVYTAPFGKPARLTTTIAIADRYGGPTAQVTMTGSAGLDPLFTSSAALPNTATTRNDEHAVRDLSELFQDAYSAANDTLRGAGQSPDALKAFGVVLVLPVEPPTPKFGVLPSENWNVTPLYRPFYLRGVESYRTVVDKTDSKVQLQKQWTLVFSKTGTDEPNYSVFCHELGHALGFGDLYWQTGYRDELAYMDDWAMMAADGAMSHHCGYHKLQANWIPDGAGTEADYGRVFPIGLPQPDTELTKELLLAPVELWRDTVPAAARVAFGVPASFPVAQLVWIDFGGDEANFGLIEAREKAGFSAGHLHFSKNLPGDGGVLITNGISWRLDDRFAVNNFYRRSLQLLNPSNILRNAGEKFDLALAPELPVKGMSVEVLDRKTVEGDTEVYRIKVTRKNAEFVDLYFATGDPYYKSPDLWVDWWGNNQPKPENLNPDYRLGQPTDQGETVRVPNQGVEPHWVVGRIRNRGQVEARDVKLNFFYMEPPGGGDGGKPLNTLSRAGLKQIGSVTAPSVPGGDAPQKIPLRWDVPTGFSGHTCILVEVEDYKIPRDSKGAALGSDDMWQVNNHAQKNVDKFQALSGSPFEPIEFDFSVHNDGVSPERAYLEPEGLPYGMTLTVTPPDRLIDSKETAIFRCVLRLDEAIIRSGCENDRRFRLHAWRMDCESSARWGGVEYEVQPREKTATSLSGGWSYSQVVDLAGKVAPNPGGGTLRIRLAYDNQQASWVTLPLSGTGDFTWTEQAPAGSGALEAVAVFEGNRRFGASRSAPVNLRPPPPIR